MIEIKDLILSDGRNIIFENISFQVNKGDFLLLFGDEDRVRMKLINCIMGYETGYAGSIHLAKDLDVVRYVPADALYERKMSVAQYFILNEERFENFDNAFCQQLCELFNINVEEKLYDMTFEDNKIVQLIAAICSNPELLIVDEAEQFISFEKMSKVIKILQLVNVRGVTVVYACNEYETLKGSCNRYIMLDGGKIVADNPVPKKDVRKKVITVPGKRSETLCRVIGEYISTRGNMSSYVSSQPMERIPIILHKLKCADYLVEEMTLAEELVSDYSRWKTL